MANSCTDYSDFPDDCCRLVLIGKTGNGKSATGNMIIGKEVFLSKRGINSETKRTNFHYIRRNNLTIQVTDTPGLADTDEQDVELTNRMKESMYSTYPGPHALLLVLSCNKRFTPEEYQVYLALGEIFGKDLPNFTIIVFTEADAMQGTIEDFEKQIDKNNSLKQIVQDVNRRYVLFNNVTTDTSTKEEQIQTLMNQVKKLVHSNGSRCYQHFFTSQVGNHMQTMLSKKDQLQEQNQVLHATMDPVQPEDETDTACKDLEELKIKDQIVNHPETLDESLRKEYDESLPDLKDRVKGGLAKKNVKHVDRCCLM